MKSRVDRIIELLVDEVEDRLRWRARRAQQAARESRKREGARTPVEPDERMKKPEKSEQPEAESPSPPPPVVTVPSHGARMMGRLALGILLAIVLVNVPLNRHGLSLATAMPDRAAFVVREGLVVKEEDEERIYIYQDGQFRWISSMDAFEHIGLTWGDVRVVEDGFLEPFEIGAPIHVLLKCEGSPHIYRLEDGEKRWIRDIEAFEAEGHVWEDVRIVSCAYLRQIPDGEPIPPDAGPPPQP